MTSVVSRWTVADGDQTITVEAAERSWTVEIPAARFTTRDAAVIRDLRRKLGIALGIESNESR